MLAQGRDLTPRVPAVVLPMPAGAVYDGVWILFKLLTFRGRSKPLSGRRMPCLASPKRLLGPRRVKLSTSVLASDVLASDETPSRTAASRLVAATPTGISHSRPLKSRLKSQNCSLCGRSPLLDIRYVLTVIFFLFFGGEISCVPSYVRQ